MEELTEQIVRKVVKKFMAKHVGIRKIDIKGNAAKVFLNGVWDKAAPKTAVVRREGGVAYLGYGSTTAPVEIDTL